VFHFYVFVVFFECAYRALLCVHAKERSVHIFTFSIEQLTASDLVYFKYPPIVSADVERSFFKYKNVLSENRCSLNFDNLHLLTVIYCNFE
jgi:hypothetical protein